MTDWTKDGRDESTKHKFVKEITIKRNRKLEKQKRMHSTFNAANECVVEILNYVQ